MFKFRFLAILLSLLLAGSTFGQYQRGFGPPPNPADCGCSGPAQGNANFRHQGYAPPSTGYANSHAQGGFPPPPQSFGYEDQSTWFQQPPIQGEFVDYGQPGYSSDQWVGPGNCGTVTGCGQWDEASGFGGENGFAGRPRRMPLRNLMSRCIAQPDCRDCNWGPIYLGIFGGGAFVSNFDTRNTFDNGMMGMLGIEEIGFSTLDGVATGGSIGRYFYRQARTEFEYTYRDNGIGDMNSFIFSDDLSTPQINDTLISSMPMPASGNLYSNSFMFNFVFDLKPRTVGCLNPYLGGGIGALFVDGDAQTPMAFFDIDDSSFAFQGIAGVNFPFRDRVDFYTEYRYLGADAISVTRTDMMGTANLGTFRFDSHNVVIGLRFLR